MLALLWSPSFESRMKIIPGGGSVIVGVMAGECATTRCFPVAYTASSTSTSTAPTTTSLDITSPAPNVPVAVPCGGVVYLGRPVDDLISCIAAIIASAGAHSDAISIDTSGGVGNPPFGVFVNTGGPL